MGHKAKTFEIKNKQELSRSRARPTSNTETILIARCLHENEVNGDLNSENSIEHENKTTNIDNNTMSLSHDLFGTRGKRVVASCYGRVET